MTVETQGEARRIIEGLLAHVSRAHRRKDADAFLSLISEETSFVVEGAVMNGRRSLEEYIQNWYKGATSIEVHFDLHECGILQSSLWDISSYRLDEQRRDGLRLFEEGIHLVIWTWNGSSWTIWKDIYQVRKRESSYGS